MPVTEARPVGDLIRHWRSLRGLSQLDMALEADVSARHVSFLETGRARPSREMILRLAEVLDVPLRQRNEWLLAGGFAPAYHDTDLSDPQLEHIRKTLEMILDKQMPYPGMVCDASWNLIMANPAGAWLKDFLCEDEDAVLADGPPNILRLLFHPKGVAKAILNFDQVARVALTRAHRTAQLGQNEGLRQVLAQIEGYPNVPTDIYQTVDGVLPLMLPVRFELQGQELEFISTLATLGNAMDIQLAELIIESYYPANPATEAAFQALAAQHSTAALSASPA